MKENNVKISLNDYKTYGSYIYEYRDDDKLYCMNSNDYEQPHTIAIQFRDGEKAVYNNAYDLQDFLNQVNHYHDLRKDFQTVVDKLLESKPELEDWVKKNFGRYIIKND